MFDYIIKNSRVIDPETKLDHICDVAVKDGTIVEIGNIIKFQAKEIIDGTGCILSPGFIDIHAHEDVYPRSGQKVLPKETAYAAYKQGVTTLVTGNCGISDFPLFLYKRRLKKSNIPINTPYFVGNIVLRFAVGLDFYKKASPMQIKLMTLLERLAFHSGAIGISFGLQYAPGTSYDELFALAQTAADCGKLMSVHMRYDYPEKAEESLQEVISVAEKTGVSLQISHLAANVYGDGKISMAAKMMENSTADISCDMYPYNVWATDICSAVFDEGFSKFNFNETDIEILTGVHAGKYCTKELFYELRNTGGDVLCACHNAMPSEDITAAYHLPYCMLGSDSQLSKNANDVYMGHPRSSSAIIKFLCDYVRDGDIPLLDGISKLTYLPAKKLGLSKKGRIQTGCDADMVLFKLEDLKVNSSFGPNVCAVAPSGIVRVFCKK